MTRRLLVTPSTQWSDAGGYLTQDGYNQIRELFDRIASIEALLGDDEGSPLLGPYQIATAEKTAEQANGTTTFAAVTGFEATLTPGAATNRFHITASIPATLETSDAQNEGTAELQLMRGATTVQSRFIRISGPADDNQIRQDVVFDAWDSPATTDPVTYSFRFRMAEGDDTVTLNEDGAGSSNMTVFEYGPNPA